MNGAGSAWPSWWRMWCPRLPGRRLDKDSEGLLLLTNDGDFANQVAHPKRHVAKTYRVTVRPAVTEEQLNQMSTGIVIEGRRTAPLRCVCCSKSWAGWCWRSSCTRTQPGDPQDVRGPWLGGCPSQAHCRGTGAAWNAPAGKIPGADKRRTAGTGRGSEERKRKP